MRSTGLQTFLLGVSCGIGITILTLYTRKPGVLATPIDHIAEKGRIRRAKEQEAKLQKERLKEVGFTEDEIDDYFR